MGRTLSGCVCPLIVVDFRLGTDPLLPRELPIGFGDGTGTQARPPLTPGNSAGLSVRNRTGEQATPPVVTAHRSSPAPSAPGCMSSPGGVLTRAGTPMFSVGRAKGSSRTHASAQEPGGLPLSRGPRLTHSAYGRSSGPG